ncbi:MAG: Two-component system response regulator [uncultured Aureispira sp.]|uniref:Two-component system response regulator n=1 Tax=uncultured Aureispira sp. TaxID=1331704 RepID=A0A6S6SMH0_9BACT|nr:MAG: Two-component system response regulator [uncultured Aureispira sp.]
MITCIIIEDQPPAQRILKKYIEEVDTLQLQATFSNAIQALEYLRINAVGLIFLDIHLPKISGLDFLKAVANPPPIILTTAFSDYALESYELSVVDYLLKPFSFQRFIKAIAKIPEKTLAESNPKSALPSPQFAESLFIKSGYEHIKIRVQDILYIKSDGDYTELFLPQKKYLSSESLRYWEANLNSDQFVRIQKSFIINTLKIEKIVGNQVHLSSDRHVPIGRAYKEGFIKKIYKI